MKAKSLTRRSLTQLAACVIMLLLLATPVFYWLTTNFYAEDMIKVINTVKEGKGIPPVDLEEDVVQGILLQFVLIVTILGLAIVIVMRFISKKLWHPFNKTLLAIERFRIEDGRIPALDDGGITEFKRLDTALYNMMGNSIRSYQMQKEFTENASHELQTPLAVFQSKLDILMQQPDITENQAEIIQDLYQMNGRLSRLSRNLLLLAKMENRQFSSGERVDVVKVIDELLPYLESLADGITIIRDYKGIPLPINANRPLLETLISNLVVNAVRHNRKDGRIIISANDKGINIANTSNEGPLDGEHIFDRFYRANRRGNGYGLGLAIVKAVCEYHGWGIAYRYVGGMHNFTVSFKGKESKH